MKSYVKTGATHIVEHVDTETGEVIDTLVNEHTYLANTKEEFWLMYSSMVLILKSSKDVRMKLFAALLERYGKGQEFSMNKTLKEIMAKECGCSPRSFDSAFTWLVKEFIVAKLGPQLYQINPRHVFQGSTTARNASLHATIKIKGCKSC